VWIYALEIKEEVQAWMDDPDTNVERIALKSLKGMKNKQANKDIPYPLPWGRG